MSLHETERKIYQREEISELSDFEKRNSFNTHAADEEPFSASSLEAPNLEKEKEIWIKAKEEKREKRKKIIKISVIALGTVAVLSGIIWAALYIRKTSFSEDQVKVSISSPEKVDSGDMVSIDIDYRNLNRASLKDAVLYLNYSENFKPSGNLQLEAEGPNASKFNVGNISGKGNGKVTIQGKFFGARDALVYLEAKLEYRSSTFNSNFAAKGNSSVYISSSPLTIDVSGPQNAASGNAVSFVIKYQNTGQDDFNDLKIKADYPDGFSFSNSDPLTATGDNIWYIGTLRAGQSGQVKINGIVSGSRDEEKSVKASIGEISSDNTFISYGDSQTAFKIIGSPLVLAETINGKSKDVFVNAGENLLFEVGYKNQGAVGLRDVIFTFEADSPILDYNQIEMRSGKGEYNPQKKTITWKSSEIPGLKMIAPGAEGKMIFAIPVKSIIPVAGVNDKNFSFTAVSRMDSPDIPTPEGSNKVVASNSIVVKLNSKLLAGLEGFYNDSDISNSGPVPMEVGQETTFTMHLKLSNVSSDVTDGKVLMVLAPGVKWKSNFLPQNASLNFNDRSNEITWNLGNISAGTGITSDPKELVFQVGVVPIASQAGSFIPLVSSTAFSAKDSFTGQQLEVKVNEKNTNLTEDLGVGDMGKVKN
jgi:hypothetical protein